MIPMFSHTDAPVKAPFFSQKDGDETKFFLNTGSEYRDKDFIDKQVRDKFVIPFAEKFLLPPNQSLWMNNQGAIWTAHSSDSAENKKVVGKFNFVKRVLE